MEFSEVYKQTNYRRFLRQLIAAGPREGRGVRSKLAAFVGCQTTYLSQVLFERGHLSLEQAEAAARYFAADEREKDFFLTLVQANRAGTAQLRRHFESRLRDLSDAHLQVRNRISGGGKVLNDAAKARYYSSWHYGAAHMLATIPKFAAAVPMAERLGLSLERTRDVVAFLAEIGLISEKGGRLTVVSDRLNLPGSSPLVAQHHLNWHLRAMQAVEQQRDSDLHYSAVATMAVSDVKYVKEVILKAAAASGEIIKDSKADDAYGMTLSFFAL